MSSLSLVTEAESGAADPSADDVRSKQLAGLLLEVARCLDQDLATVLPRGLSGDPRLEAVRTILLDQDRAEFARLRQKVDDPQEFAEAVSAVLARAFDLAGSRDERLGAVLAPTMERATQASIRKDPNILVGILYPLMGPAISKSIAETLDGTLQGLNQAFKHSFSWHGLKWRLEALRTGSTFADVVLKHTVVFRVEHVFLIHRKTGLLLEHVAAPQAASQDPHMVSGMLTAIQDFVRDSFSPEKGSTGGGIDSLRLGELLLWCEEGPAAFLAAVIRGNPPETLHGVLRATLGRIHEELRGPLEDFNGDSATLGNLAARLEPCLQQQEQPQEKHLSPWLWGLPLALLIAVGAWMVHRTVEGYRVEAYVHALQEEPGVVVTGAERRDGKWHVSGLRDPLSADPTQLLPKVNLDPERVVGHWEPYQALSPQIVVRRIRATLDPPPNVALIIDGNTNTIRALGNAPQHWVEKARAMSAALPAGSPKVDLSALKDIQDPTFIRLRAAIQNHVISFDSGAPRPSAGQEEVLDTLASDLAELIKVARGLGFSVRVMIVGHADSTGRETSNLSLSAARAEVVRSMLRSRGIAPELLSVRSAGTLEPLESGGDKQDDSINRRVTFAVTTFD